MSEDTALATSTSSVALQGIHSKGDCVEDIASGYLSLDDAYSDGGW